MAMIGFIGLGNMGRPMVRNLLKAGHSVRAHDVVAASREAAAQDGATVVGEGSAVLEGADAVITMLPAGEHVRSVYLGANGLLAKCKAKPIFIDCSTIDVGTARDVARAAADAGLEMVDAPVSGGVGGAAAGTLTIMVGGTDQSFARARPYLEPLSRLAVHAGGSGNGQAAKACNNMILGITMIGVCEAFVLGEKLGLDHAKLFEVTANSSGQCWSISNYCPVPGPVPTSPANNDYKAGFTAAMMLKDLKLAQQAAMSAGASTPLGAEAQSIYSLFNAAGNADMDFSGIINFLRGR
ncbi:MAG: 3-hydroxyisobutyrate dehydrogenase [Alphaproteobacteria bacterium]|nr:3-hydroxyisobutyrate dehydrogenase [Alphaproteobacteria bacterium]